LRQNRQLAGQTGQGDVRRVGWMGGRRRGRSRHDEWNVRRQRSRKFRQQPRRAAHVEVATGLLRGWPQACNSLKWPARNGSGFPVVMLSAVGVVLGGGGAAGVRVDALERVGVGAALGQTGGEEQLVVVLGKCYKTFKALINKCS
jgi:hypothetical protein